MHPLVVQTGREMAGRELFNPGETWVVAVSGGRDSMVLLRVLLELVPSSGAQLLVAHLDHGLRGKSSAADARFVQRQADRLGLPCLIERQDVAGLMRTDRLSQEMAARQVRHQFLARTAQAVGSRTVVLGHHRDDQIELFLLRLLRGAGGSGLGGMQWISPSPADRTVRLVRPFLGQNRAALAAFARDCHVAFRRDASNRHLEPLRNRIRNRLLPFLRRDYQRAVDETVWRTMEIVGAEAEFTRQSAARWLKNPRRGRFENLHLAVQREVIRSQLWSLGARADFRLVEDLRLTVGRPVALRPGMSVARDARGSLQAIEPVATRTEPATLQIELKGRGGACVFEGLEIRWQRGVGHGTRGRGAARPGLERFDAAKVGDRVLLRHWQPGDRFQPIGMATPVKLQDLFVNAGIERERRRQLVVAATASGELFWVEGLRMAEGFKLDKESRHRLKWQWKRGAPDGQRLVAPGLTP